MITTLFLEYKPFGFFTLAALVGALLWVCGLILGVVVKKHRQLYELELNQLKLTMEKIPVEEDGQGGRTVEEI